MDLALATGQRVVDKVAAGESGDTGDENAAYARPSKGSEA